MKNNVLMICFLFLIWNLKGQTITQKHPYEGVISQIHINQENYSSDDKPKEKKYVATISFKTEKKLQAIKYKGFVLKIPISLNLKYNLKKSHNTYKGFNVSFETLLGKQAVHIFYDTLSINMIRLEVVRLVKDIHYDEVASKELVDEYFKLENLLTDITRKLNRVSFTNPDDIEDNKKTLDKQSSFINDVKNKKYPTILNLNKYDPIGFVEKFSKLEEGYTQKQSECENAVQRWHIMYYEKGINEYNDYYKINYFNKAIEKSQQRGITYAEPYYSIAEINFKKNKYEECVLDIDRALNANPSFDLREKCILLLSEVYNQYQLKGDNNSGERAIAWYYKAKTLCDKGILNVNCNNILVKIKRERTQVFNSLLYGNSFNSLGQAQAYLNNYSNEINNPERLNTAFQNKYDECHNVARQKIQENNFIESYESLCEIESNEKKYSIFYLKKMDKTYETLFNESLNNATKHNGLSAYSLAIELLDLCTSISRKKFTIEYNQTELNNEYRTAYEGVFNDWIFEIKLIIKQNRFEEAKEELKKISEFQNENQKWLDESSTKITNQEYRALYEAEFAYCFINIDDKMVSFKFVEAFDDLIELQKFRVQHSEWLMGEKDTLIYDKVRKNSMNIILDIENRFHKTISYLDAIKYYTLIQEYSIEDDNVRNKIYMNKNSCIRAHIEDKLLEINKIIELYGNKKFSDKTLNTIKDLLGYIQVFSKKNNYQLPAAIKAEIDKMNDLVVSETCKNTQDSYNTNLTIARGYMLEINYVKAYQYLDVALNVSTVKSECNINVEEATALKKINFNAYSYQKLREEVEREIWSSKNYNNAIIKYIELENFFYSRSVSQYGIEHIVVNDYVLMHKSVDFQVAYLNYEISNNNIEFINTILDELYDKKKYINFYNIGEEIGIIERDNLNTKNYRKGIKKFKKYKHDKYKDFKKGYKKAYKNK